MTLRRLHRRRVTGFYGPSGGWRVLTDPDDSPSGRQLLMLNHRGMLELVPPGHAQPITKAEAAGAIDEAA